MIDHFHRLLRALLMSWVRVEITPEDPPGSAFDPARPVLYLLADRGISDLLVLSAVCRRLRLPEPRSRLPIPGLGRHHSVYSVASASPLTDWIRRRRKRSVMLGELLAAAADDPDIDLQVVPVSVFWGRPLARQRSWLAVLFADTWAIAGRTRKFFRLLAHGRDARLIFSPALDLRQLIDSCSGSEADLQEILIEALHRQHEATFGPQITSRRQLSAEVVEDRVVRELIRESPRSDASELRRAHRYCREIFADCTQLTIELMSRLLRAFWQRFYSDIEVFDIERVRDIALSHQLVYLPCHRSHVDYLLLSYVIYQQNLALPYIAAGNNLDIPLIGRILRGGGAFFIRRSFRDNPLYGAVLRAYVGQLVALGAPLEYFVEGGRSRTGRMLKPKFGMLGMTLEGYIRAHARPLALVPVYIGYEKLIEGDAYLGELYGGEKKRESTLGAMRAIFRLKGHFGKVTASFGEPIELNPLLDRHCADWRERADELADKPGWYQAALEHTARNIMYGINRAAVINPVNAVATVLLATPRQSIEIEELLDQVELHGRLVRAIGCLRSIRVAAVDGDHIESLARRKIVRIRRHELGDIVYLRPEQSILIGYYRNNTLHALVIPALIACCFANRRRVSRASLERRLSWLYPFLQSELQLAWPERELAQVIDDCCRALIDNGLLEAIDDGLRRPSRSDRRFVQLERLGQVVQPILERYYMTFIVIWQTADAPRNEAEIERRCHLLAQKISMIHGINSPDFFDRQLFRDFIDTLCERGYLVRNAQQQLEFAPDFDYISLDLRTLLSTDLRGSILALIGNAQGSAAGEHGVGKR